jgi:hypothetical protein
MAFFTREALQQKNNTLLVITVILILAAGIYIPLTQQDFKSILISLVLLLTCAVIVIRYLE